MDQKATEAETTKHYNSTHGEEDANTGRGCEGRKNRTIFTTETYNRL